MRPGINVTTLTSPPDANPSVNTGSWFVTGITSQGPTSVQLVTSFNQFTEIYGDRGSVPILWDSADTFFKEGGSRLFVARTVGPAATAANVTINDGSAAPAIAVSAIGPGAYADGYQIVVAGTPTSFTITVEDASGNALETSNELTSNADAVAYGNTSQVISVKSVGTGSPAAGTHSLVGGNDDVSGVTGTQYINTLTLFVKGLGVGQVSVPGVSDVTVQTALFQHAAAYNRRAVVDFTDVTTASQSSSAAAATLKSAAAPIRALGQTARPGGLFAPWCDVAPLPGSIALRPVPASAFAAAKMAQVDASTVSATLPSGNPNIPAAGKNGILTTAVDVHATFTDTDRESLNDAGVNIIKPLNGGFRVYGYRTPVDANKDPEYFMLNNVRLDMAIIALAGVVQEDYVFSQIDGQGLDAADYGNDLTAMLTPFYTAGALYGATSQDAFSVDTSPDVNSAASEAQGNLVATIALRRSPEAEQVNLNIVNVAITSTV